MPLQSRLFRDNLRLQQCLVSDPAHVLTGDRGDHVMLIQNALQTLEPSNIASSELAQQLYGPSTAGAVLRYKQKRHIVNHTYQTQADNVVGKMTVQSLDTEIAARERQHFRLLAAFGVADTAPKVAILAQNHPLPAAWAKQVAEAHKPGVAVVTSPANGTPEANVGAIKQAIVAANHGLLVFSVGHGIVVQGFKDQGGFDCADNKKMRLGGKGAFTDPATFVDVFYDDKPPPGSPLKLSDRENDEKNKPAGSEQRLKNWKIYLDLCKAFVDGKPAGVLLLTCNVGQATGFLKKVATQWQTPIIGYNEFTNYQGGFPKGRVRSIFNSDLGKQSSESPGSNIPFAEIMFPLSITKMVHVRP
jgi:peptidoglycan hydrolase-like protein with peptidoglycan-binding domain